MKRIDRSSKVRDFHQAKWDEPIIFELDKEGERGVLVPKAEEEITEQVGNGVSKLPKGMEREELNLPEINQKRVLMHYLRLSQQTLGADINIEIGQGTCTMKYNPKINDKLANSHKMAGLHPLQDPSTVQGAMETMYKTDLMIREISGLDYVSLQPGSGSQAAMTMASIMKKYHEVRGEGEQRDEIITTIHSHPSDSAAPALKGFKIIHIHTDKYGRPDYEAFKAAVSERTAGFIAANPEDTGVFNPKIKEFTKLVTEAGGLNGNDQANANGLFGVARAKEAGFDMCYFNLHKSFATPHGCGGPGGAALAVDEELKSYLPKPLIDFDGDKYFFDYDLENSIGKVRVFNGASHVILKAYSWLMSLGAEGLYEVGKVAALNNVYLNKKIVEHKGVKIPFEGDIQRIEQTRYTLQPLKEDTGFGFGDVSNRIMDFGMQIWGSHHPLYVPEPMTLEPTETPSKADLDEYINTLHHILDEAYENPEIIENAPHRSTIHQVDESSLDDPEKWAPSWRVYLRKTAEK